jgi:hypothetical protein
MINTGIIALNKSNVTPKSVIVLGVGRSGTSMVAKTLHLAGVSMNANTVTYEDISLGEAIERDDYDKAISLINIRNRQNIWGFKRPNAIVNLPKYLHRFNNPVFITVFRDILATANRNKISMKWTLEQSLTEAIQQNTVLTSFIRQYTLPNLLISYEKTIQNPEAFVGALVDFCRLEADNNLLVRAIEANNKEYLGIPGE